MTAWNVALLGGWVVLLINLGLTLRVVRKLRAEEASALDAGERQQLPDLDVGTPAPDFRARRLDGAAVRLADFAGRTTAFLVVSPDCPMCRRELRALLHLAKVARARAGVEFVLVSDYGITATRAWLEELQQQERLQVELPVLVAPSAASDFLVAYDPRVVTPFHVLVDEHGVVASRGPVGAGAWLKLRASWGDPQAAVAARRRAS
jgi:peroxiredoxin